MEAIILAGGLGTRLREAVPDLPKPMAPVNGKPFLEYVIRNLKKNGFSRIILSVGYMAEKIQNYFGDEYEGVELVYSSEDQPLGTGGAIKKAMKYCLSDHVHVLNGDTFICLDPSLLEQLWEKRCNSIIVGREIDDCSRYGALKIDDERVVGFIEKTKGSKAFINAGYYVLDTKLLNDFSIGLNFSFEKQILEKCNYENYFEFYNYAGIFIDIGIPEDYSRVESLLRSY